MYSLVTMAHRPDVSREHLFNTVMPKSDDPPVLGQWLAGVALGLGGLGTENIFPGGRFKTREVKTHKGMFDDLQDSSSRLESEVTTASRGGGGVSGSGSGVGVRAWAGGTV